MASPIIGYDSILHAAAALSPSGISSSPAPDTGFTADDLQDHRAFKLWRSSALSTPQNIDIDLGPSGADNADYLALVAHNMASQGATVSVLADSSTPPTTVRLAGFVPTSDAITFKSFIAPGNLRYWRIQLSKGGGFPSKPFIGELLLGVKTTLPEFLDADIDPFFKDVEAIAARSEGGHSLGSILRGVRRPVELRFGGEAGIARSFLTSDLNPFLDNHAYKRLPFIFVLDESDGDFGRPLWIEVPADGGIRRPSVGGTYNRFKPVIPAQEAIMESA